MKYRAKVDDLVRIIQEGGGLGPTLWVVTWVCDKRPWLVTIREAGKPLAGDQTFDASLLKKVPR